MRSLECATSELKRASLWRRWRSAGKRGAFERKRRPACASACERIGQVERDVRIRATTIRRPRRSARTESGRIATDSPWAKPQVGGARAWAGPNGNSEDTRAFEGEPVRSRGDEAASRLRRTMRLRAAPPGFKSASRTHAVRPEQSLRRGDRRRIDLFVSGRGYEVDAGAAQGPLARDDASSWRTRPAMRVTTRRNSIPDATITTSTSGFPHSSPEANAGSDHAGGRRAASGAGGVSRVRESVAGSSSSRIDGCRAAAPRGGNRRSSPRRRSTGGGTSLSTAHGCRPSRWRAGRRCC